VIWTSRIVCAGCVPEVFDCKELVTWCVEKYIPSQRIIQLQYHSPISLSPQLFHKMLNSLSQHLLSKEKRGGTSLSKSDKKVECVLERKDKKNLNDIVQACSQAISRREELFKRLMEVDLVGSTNKVQDLKLILNSLFLTKQQFDEQVKIFKGLPFENFYGILEYDEDDIDNCLVDYSVKNQNIEEALHGISLDLRDLEGELFNIKIRHEINMAPMKSYIE
jgi:hypothetical protein